MKRGFFGIGLLLGALSGWKARQRPRGMLDIKAADRAPQREHAPRSASNVVDLAAWTANGASRNTLAAQKEAAGTGKPEQREAPQELPGGRIEAPRAEPSLPEGASTLKEARSKVDARLRKLQKLRKQDAA